MDINTAKNELKSQPPRVVFKDLILESAVMVIAAAALVNIL